MDDLRFGCTLCGRCCHGHSLPLTLDEAISWLGDGGKVSIFCEGYPSSTDSAKDDARAKHRHRRSFAVSCGEVTARVTVIFVGQVVGACRNLGEDLKCRIYHRRPMVCRIYPAEISPLIQLDTATKACPAEAWEVGDQLLSGGKLVDVQLKLLVEKSRQTDRDDVPQKSLICSELNLHVSGVIDEGYIAYEPDGQKLLDLMRRVRQGQAVNLQTQPKWQFYSPSRTTAEALRAQGLVVFSARRPKDAYEFLWAESKTPSAGRALEAKLTS